MRPVLLGGDTLANNLVNIHEGVKYKENIPILTIDDDIIQAYACDYNNAGTSATVERVITPTRLMVNHTICKSTFYSTWLEDSTGGALVDGQIPNEWYTAFQDHLGEKIATYLEYTLWQGNFESSSYTDFDGVLKQADDESGTIKQNISALTASNIIAQMRLATGAMTAAMVGNTEFRLKVNRKTAHLYRQAVSNDFNNLTYANGNDPMFFDGYAIDVCPGIPDDVIAIGKTDDFHVGLNLVSDETNIQLVDTSQTLADDNVRIRAVFSGGTAVTNESQIVLAGVNIES